MIRLDSERLVLRALEPDDLTYFMQVENDASLWSVCDTRVPFSRFTLEKILESRVPDFFADKQLRLVICLKRGGRRIGFVDLFDFSPLHRRAGTGGGHLPDYVPGKGYADEAVKLAADYVFRAFNLHQLWAEVPCDNELSKALFERLGFERCGVHKDWLLVEGKYSDVNVYQLINKDCLKE